MIHTENRSAAGSYFDDFLQEQGIFDAVDAVATKRVIAWQVAEKIKKQDMNTVSMTQKMGTNRCSLARLLNASFAICIMLFCLTTACEVRAEKIAVVDVARVLAESTPAKTGEAHLQQVRAILQKGLDDVQTLYKGKEQTPEAQHALREARVALDRQLAVERQAVLRVLSGLLERAVKNWRAENSSYTVVINKQMVLDNDAKADITPAILTAINIMRPVFPPLPTVTVKPPQNTPQESSPNPAQRKR